MSAAPVGVAGAAMTQLDLWPVIHLAIRAKRWRRDRAACGQRVRWARGEQLDAEPGRVTCARCRAGCALAMLADAA
jgi:hypothetical protein